MTIGIDASRAFQKNRTGIEEYSYQVIKHLRSFLRNEQVVLYCNSAVNIKPDFALPENWQMKYLWAPIFWTQGRLSLEMLVNPPEVFFVPAHTVPLIHPKKTFVTIHGLEYEFYPKGYSFWQRVYMQFVIRNSCRWAKRIIAVSHNTKKDLVNLYKVSESKVGVIYEGYSNHNFQFPISNFQKNSKFQIPNHLKSQISNLKYFLFVGRLEKRKNIIGIVEAFEVLKKKYNVSHKLILAGKYGFGGEKIKDRIYNSEYKNDIILTGYISDEEKFYLLKNAEAFLFPTFYEGFGLPILEAQAVETAAITSSISSTPEVAGSGAVFVDPKNPEAIAEAVYKLVSDEGFKDSIIKKGLENVKRFSWEKCAREIAEMLKAANNKSE